MQDEITGILEAGIEPLTGSISLDGDQLSGSINAGIPGLPGTDASVTQTNIQSALGYLPISPSNLSDAIKTALASAEDDAIAFAIALS